jgi:YidC/Oxa1 family membrane protein insertase
MGNIWGAFVGFLEQVLITASIWTSSVAIGIVLFTVTARLVILPLTLSSIRSGRRMQEVQPVLKELQRKYGKDQQKLQEETLRVYREYKINPVGGCLPLFLQLPIFFGVYQAVYHLMVPEQRVNLSAAAAEQIAEPAVRALFSQPYFGLDLGVAAFGAAGFAGIAYLVLPVLSVLLQLIQQVMAMPRVQDPQQKAVSQAMLFMPLVFGYIAFTFPTGAVLYWVVSSLVGVIQQYFTSGWGSLANYLKFLPPDKRPLTPTLAAAAPVAAEAAVETPQVDFWSVMRPLTEAPIESAEADDSEQRNGSRSQPSARRRH